MDETMLTVADERIACARARLVPAARRELSSMRALGAAALAAISALILAAAVILGPGFEERPGAHAHR